MTAYILRHWRGELPLPLAFWVNFLLLYQALEMLEPLVWPPFLENETLVTIAVTGFIVLTKLVVFPWQLVGVIRTCSSRIRSGSGRDWAMLAQYAMAASLVYSIVLSLNSYQALQVYHERQAILRRPPPQPGYTLRLLTESRLIHLVGPFEIGITHRVEEMIRQNPGIRGIILDSDGGQIYEGRGIALLIRKNRLDTYSLESCASSCTTAFVAGVERVLGEQAKLGFHQYKTHSVIPSIDVANEQDRDMEIFRQQGVVEDFLRQAFSYSPEDMWWPSAEELIRAGVVHRVGPVPRN